MKITSHTTSRALSRLLLVLLTAMFVVSCSTLRRTPKNLEPEIKKSLVADLCSEPPHGELTADVAYNVQGRKFKGQLRMRRGRCIQLSANLLGMEMLRIELFPDHIMVMNRTASCYAECHYADLPYLNRLGLDYNVIEAMLWNRMFSPGRETVADVSSAMSAGPEMPDGSVEMRDMEWNHVFLLDAEHHLARFSKRGNGWNFSIGYSDFKELAKGYEFPTVQTIELGILETGNFRLEIRDQGVSLSDGSWKDATEPTRRMVSVPIDRMLELFNFNNQ